MLETNKDYSRVIVESSSTNCGWLRFMVKLCANSSYGIWGLRPCKNLRSNFWSCILLARKRMPLKQSRRRNQMWMVQILCHVARNLKSKEDKTKKNHYQKC
jgi:hypothetical protein